MKFSIEYIIRLFLCSKRNLLPRLQIKSQKPCLYNIFLFSFLGSGKQCFYCLKIMRHPASFRKHLESQHVFGRKPNVFTCQHCTREFANVVDFVHHLTARKHFPNKLRKKKNAEASAEPAASIVSNSEASSRLTPLSRTASRRGMSLSAPRSRLIQLLPANDSSGDDCGGEGESDQPGLYNSETEDDDSAATALAAADSGTSSNNQVAGTGFTCNQCNLSFDSLGECARHMSAAGHTSKRLTPSGFPLLRAPVRSYRGGRGRPLLASSRRRSVDLQPAAIRRTTNNFAVATVATPRAFAYECRCCPFVTGDVEKLFTAATAGAGGGHQCVAGEENSGAAFLVMCAVCRVFLLDRLAVESHRWESRERSAVILEIFAFFSVFVGGSVLAAFFVLPIFWGIPYSKS
jgi:hypothetical protein